MATQSSTTKKGTFRRMKQYRCDGFGDCNMVFSRSEHLARHIRKHTGEKPFVCEFPDCGRNFSRFDNMRQHAQIHQRFRKQNYRYPEGIHIQPRPFGLSLGGDQINPRRAIALPSEGQGEGAQTAVAKNQTIVGCGIHNNITRADSPPALPYYSTSNNNSQHGLVSPVSLSGTFEEQQQQQQQHHQDIKIKQEITDCEQDLHCLTQDELDALDGLNQFQQTPQATSGTTTGPMINTEFD